MSGESSRRGPAAPLEVITEFAPLCCSRWTFSSSRTDPAIQARGASSRAVRVIKTAVSSRSTATITERTANAGFLQRPGHLAVPGHGREAVRRGARARRRSGRSRDSSAETPLPSRVRTALCPSSRSRKR